MATVKLISSDKQEFEVETQVAKMSKALERLIDDIGTDKEIPISSVEGDVMAKIITYCQYHVNCRDEAVASVWNKSFVELDKEMTFKLILAANYLEIESLFQLMGRTIASVIEKLSMEETKDYLGLKH